ncbi:hypothetical protein [uncultured Aquimarina sp.]|uniref:hypothetical protein n=1 Tax=uncultured Aquimarina sp. TaxID=575652 RepID=UPI002623E3B6|nr:hypothetical protein [uncultured Aquimarina sp.]
MRFIEIPKIENDILLEDLSKDILKTDKELSNVNVHGRPGQKQAGVDVYAREIETGNWIGIQCKVRSTNKSFTKSELLKEVKEALNFNPKIEKYYLYTTLNRDTKTQAFERDINDSFLTSNDFTFEVKFWEDIQDMLKEERCENVYYRYYHKFFKDNLSLGHSIGKLINLELQFDNIPDSKYELMIGKIPRTNQKATNVDYFRGTYFISNFLDKTIEFFTKSHNSNKAVCFPSDIYDAFDNMIDRYRICKWIQSIENLDDFIYDDTHNYTFSITTEERNEYERDD